VHRRRSIPMATSCSTAEQVPPVRLHKPVAYQNVKGVRHDVAADYALDADDVSFKIGDYDPNEPLVIDPVLVYSTFLGGNKPDVANAIAVDGDGNAWVTGYTYSSDFPTLNPLQLQQPGGYYDVFVTKLNAAGSALLFSTYLGGNGVESGTSIAVDG